MFALRRLAIRPPALVRMYSARMDAPFVATLKTDLKTAMRAKDVPRLQVLRGILSTVVDLSKTPKPVTSDVRLSVVMRNRIKSATESIDQFQKCGRDDLVKAEEVQVKILQEYIERMAVPEVSLEEIQATVNKIARELQDTGGKFTMGEIIKQCDKVFENAIMDRAVMVKLAKKVVKATLQEANKSN